MTHHTRISCSLLLLGMALLSTLLVTPVRGRTEEERVELYHARNYTWPPEKFVPDTPGWRKLFEHRLRQVGEIKDRSERFEGFAQTISAGFLQKNFTEHGFGLARAPDGLMEDLRQAIRKGVEEGPRLEAEINAITEPRPWFIDRKDLTQRVLEELQHYPEAWTGFELTPVIAYGFRLYRNTSRLHVHVDKTRTHVISFILHIDSSDDAEPWPILIEDLQGTTHEVTLKSGDLLFYESSKCFHGRPRPFKGSWYSSVFVHYYPTHGYKETFDNDAKVIAIPPHWSEKPDTEYEIPLKMHGTTMEEPTCENYWCNTNLSRKWSGPGEHGYVLNPDGSKTVLDITNIGGPKKTIRNDSDHTKQKKKCEDEHHMCAEWAIWDSDECINNANYMERVCPKSCGVCTPDAKIQGDEL